MDQVTIQRYLPGGDIYATYLAQYGVSAANIISNAALTGDENAINAAVTQVQSGPPLNTSTASILGTQLATNPLGAPADALGTILNNTLGSLFKNPLLLIVIVGAVFFYFGGAALIRRRLA